MRKKGANFEQRVAFCEGEFLEDGKKRVLKFVWKIRVWCVGDCNFAKLVGYKEGCEVKSCAGPWP